MSVDDTFKDKHLWVKKATGLGVTEFMLRMNWLEYAQASKEQDNRHFDC